MTNTKDLSLGQNSLMNHQKVISDRQKIRDRINAKLDAKHKKVTHPRNLKNCFDRDLDYRKKMEDQGLRTHVSLKTK